MSSEREILVAQKAAMFDLKRILKEALKKDPEKTYTYEELENLIDAYITGLEQ